MTDRMAPQEASNSRTAEADALRDHRLIRFAQVRELVPLSTSKIYELINEGEFPRPIKLSRQCVAWRLSDVVAWIDARSRKTDSPPSNQPQKTPSRSEIPGR